jgi:cytochrome c biogenesis protein
VADPTVTQPDDLAVAAEALSTAEAVPGDVDADRTPAIRRPGLVATLRRGWRQLTSMRTALVLLFLLALAAVPGSLFPQRRLDLAAVLRYYDDHPALAPVLDRIGLFDVFSSLWFYTLYGLLAVSLIGCLTPRIRLHAKAITARPPAAPRNFSRLPHSTEFAVATSPEAVQEAAHRVLRRRRWRTDRRTADGGVRTVAAEKGYARETGNLVFHVALLALLVAVAIGSRYRYEGQFALVEGRQFTNVAPLYDRLVPGAWVDPGDLVPFSVQLDDFRASFLPNGQPADFEADVTWSPRVGEPVRRTGVRVNHPLNIAGTKVYLLGHGYAPRFVVRDPDGRVVYDDYRVFLAQQGANQLSLGVLKVPNGVTPEVGMEAAFFPTVAVQRDGGLFSSSPEPRRPALSYVLYQGDLGLTVPQDDFALDKRRLTPVRDGLLEPGGTVRLDNGTTVTFADFREYAVLQTTRDPGARPALVAAVIGLIGLMGSLFVRRRRVWVRATPLGRGTVVSVGGLARHDAERFRAEFAAVAGQLSRSLSPPGEERPERPSEEE